MQVVSLLLGQMNKHNKLTICLERKYTVSHTCTPSELTCVSPDEHNTKSALLQMEQTNTHCIQKNTTGTRTRHMFQKLAT